MSWDAYCVNLKASGSIETCAILGLDGGVWAQDGFDGANAADIAKLMSNPQGGGTLTLNGLKHLVLRATGNAVYTRKGSKGSCIAKSGKAVVVGTYDTEQSHSAGNCNLAVEKLAEYLSAQGY
eukprot:CAMPEP_0113884272 /NCGR_PEP_ID=MMETSP0780_2-20120614/10159_1 /TAXON_ID=652834 /ORGANISM="Palpitomonas bilix" /LENGTH=122 /DNA_ID=CAMNT_0000871861 /DNA_START=94 /DNA_END=462 /DNA_ORIENTATION=- /assembly_acc=CAM_ASM_000599